MTRPGRLPRLILAVASLIETILILLPAVVADLGVRGANWPVAETGLLVEMEARLPELLRSGELVRMQAEMRAWAWWQLAEPALVAPSGDGGMIRSRDSANS